MATSLGIKIIRGRAYHPQTQGSVEKANDIVKKRLIAISGEEDTKHWVQFLPVIEDVINNTFMSCLPHRVTPNEVWYNRKPWSPSLQGEDTDEDRELALNDTASDDETIFSELHKRVLTKNTQNAAKMVKMGGKHSTFTTGQLVTLAIPRKNRLSAESTRLPCRVFKVIKNAYGLICEHGTLKGLHQGSVLKPVLEGVTFNIPEIEDPRAPKLTLPGAITLHNNRMSISVMQRAGRKQNSTTKTSKKSRKEVRSNQIKSIQASEPEKRMTRSRK